jgi:hypothetical protein
MREQFEWEDCGNYDQGSSGIWSHRTMRNLSKNDCILLKKLVWFTSSILDLGKKVFLEGKFPCGRGFGRDIWDRQCPDNSSHTALLHITSHYSANTSGMQSGNCTSKDSKSQRYTENLPCPSMTFSMLYILLSWRFRKVLCSIVPSLPFKARTFANRDDTDNPLLYWEGRVAE